MLTQTLIYTDRSGVEVCAVSSYVRCIRGLYALVLAAEGDRRCSGSVGTCVALEHSVSTLDFACNRYLGGITLAVSGEGFGEIID